MESNQNLFYSTEAEVTILRNLLQKPDLTFKLEQYNEQIFYSVIHQDIYKAIKTIYRNHNAIDMILIKDYLKKNKTEIPDGYIEKLAQGKGGKNFDKHLEILLDLYWKREISKIATEIDYTVAASDIKQSILNGLNNVEMGIEEESISEALFKTGSDLLSGVVEKGIFTGLRDIDENLLGFHKGQLITIAARSGVGKTTLAINTFTHQVFNGVKAIYFSLEMPKSEIIQKMLSIKGNITTDKMRHRNFTEEEKTRISNITGYLADKKFNIFDKNSKITYITSKIREEHIKGKCEIAYVDLINRVTTNKRTGSRAEEVGTITRELKQLAMELEIPIVILAQINRGAEHRDNKRPLLSDLKESGSIEEDSDVVIGVYRNLQVCDRRNGFDGEIDLDSDNPDKNPERVELNLLKSRYTGGRDLVAEYIGNICTIKDLPRRDVW